MQVDIIDHEKEMEGEIEMDAADARYRSLKHAGNSEGHRQVVKFKSHRVAGYPKTTTTDCIAMGREGGRLTRRSRIITPFHISIIVAV